MRGQTLVRVAGFVVTALMVALSFQGTAGASAASHNGTILPASSAAGQKGYAVAISGPLAIVGAPGRTDADGRFIARGAAYIYAESDGRWSKQATFTDDADDAFGQAVAIYGNVAVVGALYRFWVFTRSGTAWHRTGPLQAPRLHGNNYIQAISVFQRSILLGLPYDNHGRGNAMIFRYSRGTWSQKTIFWAPLEENDFGFSVAMSGKTAVIGNDINNSVHVYVRGTSPGGWHLAAHLTGSQRWQFGTAVAISGTTMAIGAPGATDGNGAVLIYQRGTGGWTRRARVNPPGHGRFISFGRTLALSGGRLLTGVSNQTDRKCGAADEFKESGSQWIKTTKILNPGCSQGDEFGSAVALSGRTAVIGAPGWHGDRGNAYVEQIP